MWNKNYRAVALSANNDAESLENSIEDVFSFHFWRNHLVPANFALTPKNLKP